MMREPPYVTEGHLEYRVAHNGDQGVRRERSAQAPVMLPADRSSRGIQMNSHNRVSTYTTNWVAILPTRREIRGPCLRCFTHVGHLATLGARLVATQPMDRWT